MPYSTPQRSSKEESHSWSSKDSQTHSSATTKIAKSLVAIRELYWKYYTLVVFTNLETIIVCTPLSHFHDLVVDEELGVTTNGTERKGLVPCEDERWGVICTVV